MSEKPIIVNQPLVWNTASWVLRERATGYVIAETFNSRAVARLNNDKYEAVPIGEYLAGLNLQLLSRQEEQEAPEGK